MGNNLPLSQKKKRIVTVFSTHNRRKASVLMATFGTFKTAYEVAVQTLPQGADLKIHHRLVQRTLSPVIFLQEALP